MSNSLLLKLSNFDPKTLGMLKGLGTWGGIGAGAGALGMGAANIMGSPITEPNDDPNVRHRSLLHSMLLGATMGGAAGLGARSLKNIADPTTAYTSNADVINKLKDQTSYPMKAVDMFAGHPHLAGGAAGGLSWGISRARGIGSGLAEGWNTFKGLGDKGPKWSKLETLPKPDDSPGFNAWAAKQKASLMTPGKPVPFKTVDPKNQNATVDAEAPTSDILTDTAKDELERRTSGSGRTLQVSALNNMLKGLGNAPARFIDKLHEDRLLPVKPLINAATTKPSADPRLAKNPAFADVGPDAKLFNQGLPPSLNKPVGTQKLRMMLQANTYTPLRNAYDRFIAKKNPYVPASSIAPNYIDPTQLHGQDGKLFSTLSAKFQRGIFAPSEIDGVPSVSRHAPIPKNIAKDVMMHGEDAYSRGADEFGAHVAQGTGARRFFGPLGVGAGTDILSHIANNIEQARYQYEGQNNPLDIESIKSRLPQPK